MASEDVKENLFRERILLNPDKYIGSTVPLTKEMFIWDFEREKMIKKEITFVPGLYKIYDEILVNAADNKLRDANMSVIRVDIDKGTNTIKVYNNGKGIPIVDYEKKILVPTLIFGRLLTPSKYIDDKKQEEDERKEKKKEKKKKIEERIEEKKVTGGRNGYGAKLCNVFSQKFAVETSSKEYKRSFKQVWWNNMINTEQPVIDDAKEEDFTTVTFQPDLAKFKIDKLDSETIALFAKRVYDIAACLPSVNVYLNNKRLTTSKFEDYCKLYLNEEDGEATKLIYSKIGRWEIALAPSGIGFQQVSFVNSIATTKGGRHVDYITDQLVQCISEFVSKKNQNDTVVMPFQIKSYIWVFINCLIENPTFDSQTKENMTLPLKSFGSECKLSTNFVKKIEKCVIVENILTSFKKHVDLEEAGSKSKQSEIKALPNIPEPKINRTKNNSNGSMFSLVDGFKLDQRKIIFTFFNLNMPKKIKITQLVDSVTEFTADEPDVESLMNTIMNLAQTFVGSNNINLLQPIGQFGTRLRGGKDAASPHCLFTTLHTLTRFIFNPKDDSLITYQNKDGLNVTPEWYCPIIPMVLVNGANDVGTNVPNYNAHEIIKNLKRMLNNEDPLPMKPYFKNFRGKIDIIDEIGVLTSGEIAVIGDNTIEITELPVGLWTEEYEKEVLQPLLGKDVGCIGDYSQHHTFTTVRFVVKMTEKQLEEANKTGLHQFFKLQKLFLLNSMILCDEKGFTRRYDNACEILKEFFQLRLKYYEKRKAYMESALTAECVKLENLARFITETNEDEIKLGNLKKNEIVDILRKRGYAPDPIGTWEARITPSKVIDEEEDYDYILSMPMLNLTIEMNEMILKKKEQKINELNLLLQKSHKKLWLDDLHELSAELNKVEIEEYEQATVVLENSFMPTLSTSSKMPMMTSTEYLPARNGDRIEAFIDRQLYSSIVKSKVNVTNAAKGEHIHAEERQSGTNEIAETELVFPLQALSLQQVNTLPKQQPFDEIFTLPRHNVAENSDVDSKETIGTFSYDSTEYTALDENNNPVESAVTRSSKSNKYNKKRNDKESDGNSNTSSLDDNTDRSKRRKKIIID